MWRTGSSKRGIWKAVSCEMIAFDTRACCMAGGSGSMGGAWTYNRVDWAQA